MTRRIFLNSFLVGLVVLALCSVLFFSLQYTQTQDETYTTLHQEADYIARGLVLSGFEYFDSLDSPNRITVITPQGDVLYDNMFGSGISNQSGFAEVREALVSGEGRTIRNSASSGKSTMYYAEMLPDGNVLRLARPTSALRSAIVTTSPVVWVAVLVTILSGVFSFRIANRLLRPVNELDLDNPDLSSTYPELEPLVSRIQEQNLTIREQMDELYRRQKEFTALTDSMSEGFVLIDRKGSILSVNTSSLRLVTDAKVGDDVFTHITPEMASAVHKALEGERDELIIGTEGRSWQLIASPVLNHKQVAGAVLLIMDVTEREQRERLRQEFSANVSHELKTPLTSISGFAELMMNGMVPPEKVAEFSGDIYHESSRLISLVDDIIKLSKLDEENAMPEAETVDLYDLAADTVDSLQNVAKKQNVTMELTGEHVTVKGVWRLLSEMIYNLCDNAIKYNRPGGSVTVSVTGAGETAVLKVKDTGIGIPYADQSRVFERFYRVDKSHSKEIGGTGLGLSIVKHGAQYMGAQLKLESAPGVGTTVTIVFHG